MKIYSPEEEETEAEEAEEIQESDPESGDSPTSIKIAEGVEKIESQEFLDRSDLADIVLPASVKEVGTNAFKGCSSLTSIRIPGGCLVRGRMPERVEMIWETPSPEQQTT